MAIGLMVVISLLKKRLGGSTMSVNDEDQPKDVGEEDRQTNKRSERKRQREKQRRSDLSNAFEELATMIVTIEPESADQDSDNKKKRKKSEGDDISGITRLDLIGRAVRIMRRLHAENEERKRMIAGTREKGGGNSDNVLVMVPTLTPTAEDPYPVARASYPTYPAYPPPYFHSSHPQQSAADFQSQLTGRPSPHSHYPVNWGGYGKGQTQAAAMPPQHVAYGSPPRMNHPQGRNPYSDMPRSSSSGTDPK